MKLLAALAICSSFFLVTAKNQPQPCYGPKLLEGQMVTFDPSKHFEMWSKFAFDGIQKRICTKSVLMMDKGVKISVYNFLLYKENIMFQFYPQNNTCVKTPLRVPFLPIAIPRNATFVSQIYIGGSSAPREGILANVWSGEINTVHYMATFTEVGCLPVSEVIYTKETGWVTEMFYDLTTGISDPNVFIPPPKCLKLNN
ncbi:mammalian ependymin-related protein 1-like [Chiloscyllium plagiosum]|uniref:mammalian ependymin-related protein 1-like n=1 Tax=Chiloscyllium plagiosum TaxID=36176 RepID=UPI001CB7EE11|nr:mammalian ependymin-related protein 1-like [Chiloscyllium plagiosum]